MELGNLKSAEGATKKRKRVGRGTGSGHGKTSCKGHKGQKARSGGGVRRGFEGGQMPLQRRVPKRGFTNIFKKIYEEVNINDLNGIDSTSVTPDDLFNLRIIRKKDSLVKILGNGEINKAIEVTAHAFSASAVEKLEKAGGKAIRL